MKKQRLAFSVLVPIAALVVAGSIAHADVFLKQKHHTDAFEVMGQTQPAVDLIQRVWMTDDRIRSDDEKQSVIIRLDKGVMYVLDHTQKTYAQMPLALSEALGEAMEAMDEERSAGEEAEPFAGVAQGLMKMKMTVTETGETRKINQWDCNQYVQRLEAGMMTATSEIWATEDLEIDYDLFARFSASLLALLPGHGESLEEALKEMKKIEGVPILSTSTTSMMNTTVKSSQELLEFKEGTAPAGVFDLPEGYSQQKR